MPYVLPREYGQARVYYNWTTQWHNANATTTAARNVWYNWTDAGTATTSVGQIYYASNTIDTWNTWNTTTATTGAYDAWTNWVLDEGIHPGYNAPVYTPNQLRQAHGYSAGPAYTQPRETEEERLAREAHWTRIREEQEAARIQRDIEQAAVREKALDLLGMVLSKQQMEEYHRTRSFRVRGSHGRRYRVHHGTSGNVRQIVEQAGREQEVAALCAHPRMYDAEGVTGQGPGYLPTEDCLAAQALALMTNEEEFIRTANIHRGRLQPA